MREVIGHPTIQQVKRWCKNKDRISFKYKNNGNSYNAIISKVKPTPAPEDEDYDFEITVISPGWYGHIANYHLREIIQYSIPTKKHSIILEPNYFSKKDLILQHGDTFWHVNKKLLAARSLFFQKLIKIEEEKVKGKSSANCLFFQQKNKKQIFINLDHLFDNERQLKLLFYWLDREEIDDFIHTPKDALSLLDIVNIYQLHKTKAGIQEIENQIKDRFFQLISEGVEVIKPDKLSVKTKLFLTDIQQELVAHCEREDTKLSRHLLGYLSQIKKNNSVTIYAANRAYLQSLRLLIFCNFKIFSLTTIGLIPNLFKECNLSSLSLHTLKIHPDPQDNYLFQAFYTVEMESLLDIIRNSTTLILVQIGLNNNPNQQNPNVSFIQETRNANIGFPQEIIRKFNLLKPELESRLCSFYKKSADGPFFKKLLPQQQSHYLIKFLTLDDLAHIKAISNHISPSTKL